MNTLFDDLARIIASPVSRRDAFRLVSTAVGGTLLVSLGLASPPLARSAGSCSGSQFCCDPSSCKVCCNAGCVCCGNGNNARCCSPGSTCCGTGSNVTCCPSGCTCCGGVCCTGSTSAATCNSTTHPTGCKSGVSQCSPVSC